MIAPLTIYQANLSNQGFPYLFTFHKLSYMNHIYTCERRNCAKLSSDRLSSDESFAFPSSGDCCYVSYFNFMPQCCSVSPFETRSSYGTHLLDHLAAHRAGLTGTGDNQLAAITVTRHNFCLSFSFCFNFGYHLGWSIRIYLVPDNFLYTPTGFPNFVIFPCTGDMKLFHL